jgi:hypothetical protein
MEALARSRNRGAGSRQRRLRTENRELRTVIFVVPANLVSSSGFAGSELLRKV